MCTSFYLGALRAAAAHGPGARRRRAALRGAARRRAGAGWRRTSTNGEYFVQKVQWKDLRAGSPLDTKSMVGEYSPEALELLEKEGPKYQYGDGCLSDGVLGAWMAAVCGVGEVLDRGKIASHLRAVHRYNLRKDLLRPRQPAAADVRLRRGRGAPPLHLAAGRGPHPALRLQQRGLDGDRVPGRLAPDADGPCRTRAWRSSAPAADRYDGRVRNPFDEYECGHWYARAMSSYGLIQGLTGVRYDAVERVLHVEPRLPGDFRSFLSTATGYGTAGCAPVSPSSRCARGRSTSRGSTTGRAPSRLRGTLALRGHGGPGLRRGLAAATVAVLLAAGCGGGGTSSPTTPATPTPPAGDATKLVVLDSGNFDALVLGMARPSLVKFQSPT